MRSFVKQAASIGALAVAVGGVRVNAQTSSEVDRARLAIVEAVQDRMGPEVRVELDQLTCRLGSDAGGPLVATPNPAGRTGQAIRFSIAAASGDAIYGAAGPGEATAVVHVSGAHVRARRGIEAGRRLVADDLEAIDGAIEGVPLRHLPTLAQTVGARLIRAVREGEPLGDGAVVAEPVIRAGERVRVTARARGIEVEAVAVAEQSGRPDQIIRVVNADSRRAIRVRVVSAGQVEVLGDP
jgi:flagella basal body P-ring formation protein FlgA